VVEVLIAGAGPAGAVAALILARAGARVLVLDRATFPRDKLCGDTLNPGALALLRRLEVAAPIEQAGLALEGMRLTGERGLSVRANYPGGLVGRALSRRHLDSLLVDAAVQAGARIELGARVSGALVETTGGAARVRGAVVCARGRDLRIPAAVTIAADGRRSTLAFSLGLARQPALPRRWAIGAYYEGVIGLEPRGEMHIRPGHYIGVAPLPGGIANACLVTPPRPGFERPAELLEGVLASDPMLRERFARATRVTPCVTIGPLAVDARAAGAPGLLLAGDAAGFIDPMTGDGLRFAIEGGWLAAKTALEWLEQPQLRGWERLAARRRAAFGWKRRFDRGLRRMVASPMTVRAATLGAAWAPPLLAHLVRVAGDVGLARRLGAS
jgi:flavin-dependent dehydrogenase